MIGTSCCGHKGPVKKGAWTKEEDERLTSYVQRYGEGSWKTLPKAAGLTRCGKSCRLRWINYLRPNLKRGNFTKEDDKLIIGLQSIIGNKWSIIASRMPGRTDNEIKNYWNTHIKRRLKERERGTSPQPQPKNNIIKAPTVSAFQPSQPFSMQSGVTTVNPWVNNIWNVGTSARDSTINPMINNIWNVGTSAGGSTINPMVNNIWNVGKAAHAISSSDFSSSKTTTVLFSDQENNKPTEVNLELSLSLPQPNDAVKINEKFMLEKKWNVYQPQVFGKMSLMRPVSKESVCLCYNLGGFLNSNKCKKCGCGIDDDGMAWSLSL